MLSVAYLEKFLPSVNSAWSLINTIEAVTLQKSTVRLTSFIPE